MLTELFTTEFIGRDLSPTALNKITSNAFSKLSKRIGRFGIELSVDCDVIDFISQKGLIRGGVRNILSFIKQNIENKAAAMISRNECEREDQIKASLDDHGVSIEVNKKSFR